jgi:hypothetical protein
MEWKIVSNSKRTIVEFDGFDFIYIPMTEEEKVEYAPTLLNACWRLTVER